MRSLIVFYLCLSLLSSLPLISNAADESKTADVTKNVGETGTVERTVAKYSDSLYIPLWSSKSYIRDMNITVGGNYVIKKADSVSGDSGSNWMIIKNNQTYPSLNNVKDTSVLYRGTQKKAAFGKNYRPQFTGIAGPTGGGTGQPADYSWKVKMDGDHAIVKHEVGICGPAIAFEGSTTRRIELYIARTTDSPPNLLDMSVTVYFTINFVASNLQGIHHEDFSGYQNGNPSSIFKSGASWDNEKQAFKTTIPVLQNHSSKIVMEASTQTNLQENSFEQTILRIVDDIEGIDYVVAKAGEESKATFFNWITNKQEQNAKLFPECDIHILKDITRFGDKTNPSLQGAGNISTNDIKQGSTGDCYFLAVLLALADRSPGRTFIMNHSHQCYIGDDSQSNNKTFSVGFAGQANTTYSFKSNSPTFLNVGQRQASLSGDYHLENNALQDGAEIWPQLYEAAWVEHKAGKPGLFAGDRWDKIDGGYIDKTWTEVTGKGAQWVDVRGMTNDAIKQTINDAQSTGKWICVAAQWKPGMGYYGNNSNNNLSTTGLHAYYVKNISNTILLLNPWGYNRSVNLLPSDFSAIEVVYILDPVN